MKEEFKVYNVSDLKVVDVRKYNGIEDGSYSWTFLGYDIVKIEMDGCVNSIFGDGNDCYKFLKPMTETKYAGFYDHSGIRVGDIRVKELVHLHCEVFGGLPFVSKSHIKNWIKKNSDYEFLNYKVDENGKKLIKK